MNSRNAQKSGSSRNPESIEGTVRLYLSSEVENCCIENGTVCEEVSAYHFTGGVVDNFASENEQEPWDGYQRYWVEHISYKLLSK